MNSIALEILFFLISFAAVLIGVIGLPGNFVVVLFALIAVLWGDGIAFTWFWFGVFVFIAASGEVVDQLTGIFGAKKAGSSKIGMFGAALGGILGGIVGTAIFPVVGSLIGVFAGCYILTFLFEYVFSRRSIDDSRKASIGAVAGKAAAVAYKFIAGFVLLVLMAWRFWFIS